MSIILKENASFNKIYNLLAVIFTNVKKFENLNIIDLGLKFFEDLEKILNLQLLSNTEIIHLLKDSNLNKISQIFEKNYLINKTIMEKLISSVNIVLNVRKNFSESLLKEKKKILLIENYQDEKNLIPIMKKSDINPLFINEIEDKYNKIMKGNLNIINNIKNMTVLNGITNKICDSLKENNLKNINFLNNYLNKMDFAFIGTSENKIYKKLNEMAKENNNIIIENNNLKEPSNFDDKLYKILIDNVINDLKNFLETSNKKIFFRAVQTMNNFNKKLKHEKETETDFKLFDIDSYDDKIKNWEEQIKDYKIDISELDFIIIKLNKEINSLNKTLTQKDNLLSNYKSSLDENLLKLQNSKPNEKLLNKKIDTLKENIDYLHEKVKNEKDFNKNIVLENDRLKYELKKIKSINKSFNKSKSINKSKENNDSIIAEDNLNNINLNKINNLNINKDHKNITKRIHKSMFNSKLDIQKRINYSIFNKDNIKNNLKIDNKRNSIVNNDKIKNKLNINSQKFIEQNEIKKKKIVTFNNINIENESDIDDKEMQNDDNKNLKINNKELNNLNKKLSIKSNKSDLSIKIIKNKNLSPNSKSYSKKIIKKNSTYENKNISIKKNSEKIKIKKKSNDFVIKQNSLNNNIIKKNSINNKIIKKNKYTNRNSINEINKNNRNNKNIKLNSKIYNNSNKNILFNNTKLNSKNIIININKENPEKIENLPNKNMMKFFSTNNNFRKTNTNYSNTINNNAIIDNNKYHIRNKKKITSDTKKTTLNLFSKYDNKFIKLKSNEKNFIKLKENIIDNIFYDIFNKEDIKKINIPKNKKIFYGNFIQNIISTKYIDYWILATNNGRIKLDEPIFKNIEKMFFVNLESPYKTFISKFKINNEKKEMNLPKFTIDKIIMN